MSNFALLLIIQFALFFIYFIFFFFSAKILSGPYPWNRYSQRLQIECAAWSYGLILHSCLISNSLHYFLFFYFFASRFCPGHISWTVTCRGGDTPPPPLPSFFFPPKIFFFFFFPRRDFLLYFFFILFIYFFFSATILFRAIRFVNIFINQYY